MNDNKEQWIKENLKNGEKYAGIILGKDGAPDEHLILLPGQSKGVDWEAAKSFAVSVGGELPTRREQSLLFANLKEEFKPHWYWSGEQYDSDSIYAWVQHFTTGYQGSLSKSGDFSAVAVRRLVIQ